MALNNRVDIKKCQAILSFSHLIARYLACNYFRKNRSHINLF